MIHLLVCLGRAGWGEASMGIGIAEDLVGVGDSVRFLIHSSVSPLFANKGFEIDSIDDNTGGITDLLVQDLIESYRPDSIILCDFFTTCSYLRSVKIDAEFLMGLGVPIIALDTWDFPETRFSIDMYFNDEKRVPNWIDRTPFRLIPSPIVRPVTRRGVYSCLPKSSAVDLKVRRHVRSNLGLLESDKAVLFCTAAWQQADYDDEHARRLAGCLPSLISQYIKRSGSTVHLIHVGPNPYVIDDLLADRYHWLPQLKSGDFDLLLPSMDLQISANLSARSIARSIVSGVPTVVIQNSYFARDVAEARILNSGSVSAEFHRWLLNALPLYPFKLWPLGFHKFLSPMTRENSYCNAVKVAELFDEEQTISTISGILFDPTKREEILHSQLAYAHQVSELPGPARTVREFLE